MAYYVISGIKVRVAVFLARICDSGIRASADTGWRVNLGVMLSAIFVPLHVSRVEALHNQRPHSALSRTAARGAHSSHAHTAVTTRPPHAAHGTHFHRARLELDVRTLDGIWLLLTERTQV